MSACKLAPKISSGSYPSILLPEALTKVTRPCRSRLSTPSSVDSNIALACAESQESPAVAPLRSLTSRSPRRLAQGGQLQQGARAYIETAASYCGTGHSRALLRPQMLVPERLGEQVPEDLCRGRVPWDDPADIRSCGDHGIPDAPKELADIQVLRTHGQVLDTCRRRLHVYFPRTEGPGLPKSTASTAVS